MASTVDMGVTMMRAFQLDTVVAVGGGSVMDTGKAIAACLAGGLPARSYLSGIRTAPTTFASLPVIAVPTLPGSGSEVNGTCVLIDDETGRKLSASSELWSPRFALVEPQFAALAPGPILGGALVDALCHGLEAGLSVNATLATDFAARGAIQELMESGEAAMNGDLEALANCWWASIQSARALSVAGSIVTHPLAHPLSARFGVPHGLSVGLLEPIVLRELGGKMGHPLTKVAGWTGSKATTAAGRVRALASTIEEWAEEIGLPAMTRLEASDDVMDLLVDDVLKSGSRGLANTPGVAIDEPLIRRVYAVAFRR
jgi:alcohol dehydrogenase class IV